MRSQRLVKLGERIEARAVPPFIRRSSLPDAAHMHIYELSEARTLNSTAPSAATAAKKAMSSSPASSQPSSSLTSKKNDEAYCGVEDLPDPILELFLERLPISDYIRFAAVCRRWKSVQRNHRLRHSPSPPPMLPLPLLVPYQRHLSLASSSWYSPFEGRFYRFDVPIIRKRVHGSSHGWLFLLRLQTPPSDSPHGFLSLLDPVTSLEIQLPPHQMQQFPSAIGMSSPPTDAGCMILIGIKYSSSSILWKAGDTCWTDVRGDPFSFFTSIVFFRGKFYADCAMHGTLSLDPSLPDSRSFESLNMDRSQFLRDCYTFNYLVECDGELLLVQETFKAVGGQAGDKSQPATGFGVFRADLRRMVWERVESIGDHVIFIGCNSFSLLACNVIGARNNCIYYSSSMVFEPESAGEVNRCDSWTGYDLETGTLFHSPLLLNAEAGCDRSLHGRVWYLPRLTFPDPAASN